MVYMLSYLFVVYLHYVSRGDDGYLLSLLLVFIPAFAVLPYAQLLFYGKRRASTWEWCEAFTFAVVSVLAGGVYEAWNWRAFGPAFWILVFSAAWFTMFRHQIAAWMVKAIPLEGTDALNLFQVYPPRGRSDMGRVLMCIGLLWLLPLLAALLH